MSKSEFIYWVLFAVIGFVLFVVGPTTLNVEESKPPQHEEQITE